MSKKTVDRIKGVAFGLLLAAVVEYTLGSGVTNMILVFLSIGVNVYILHKIHTNKRNNQYPTYY